MKVAIGCDHAGFHLKELIKDFLKQRNDEVEDYGCYSSEEVDYPGVAFSIGEDISTGKVERGIIICGTGIGVAIAANKVPGIRAALCHDTYSAERARGSNNAQVLTMGAKVIGPELALKIVDTWMNKEFDGGNSARKVQQIVDREEQYLKSEQYGEDSKQSAYSC